MSRIHRTSRLVRLTVALVAAHSLAGPLACKPAAPPATAATGQRGRERPPIFDARPYREAKQVAETERKLFLVKATAEWCGPCKRMDATTWRDPNVVQWAKEHAIVVAVDVDAEPTIARELRIEAMPTMVVFKDGAEFDRIVGAKSADELLAWLNGVMRGETAISALERRTEGLEASGGTVDVQARLDLAKARLHARDYTAALDSYAWLWEHMLEHGQHWHAVRASFMAGDIAQLVGASPAAAERFTRLRDATRSRLVPDLRSMTDLNDFITLNRILGDEAATLTWFDSVKEDEQWRPALARHVVLLQESLVNGDRMRDLGLILIDPVRQLDSAQQMLEWAKRSGDAQVEPGAGDSMAEMARTRLRADASILYAALLAADRDEAATTVARRALELDSTSTMVQAVVARALKVGEPRPEQLELIESVRGESTPASQATLASLSDAVREALDER